jgi:hypothetical protein
MENLFHTQSRNTYKPNLNLKGKLMNRLLKIARRFELKLAGPVRINEVTVVGDPKAPIKKEPEPGGAVTGRPMPGPTDQCGLEPEEVFQKGGWNWKPKTYPTPFSDKDKQTLLQLGYKYIQGVGMVPPGEVNWVTSKLREGWVYTGPVYGLVPKTWSSYLKRIQCI